VKRVLFVRRAYAFGGAELRLLDWLSRIDYSNNEVLVANPVDVFSNEIAKRGLPSRFVPVSPDESRQLYGRYDTKSNRELGRGSFWQLFRAWFRFLRRIHPDQVVIMEGYFFDFPLGCVLAAFLITRGNTYMTEHVGILEFPPRKTSKRHFGFIPGLGLWWYRQVWPAYFPWHLRSRLSKRILAASETVRKRAVEYYDYPSNKMGIINHGVDVERFRPSAAQRTEWRRTHMIPETDLVIVSTARLSREKRLDLLLEAFWALSARYQNLWLVLAGDGPLREELQQQIAARGDSRVRMPGLVKNVAPLLQGCDIYALASDNEGFGIALVEAMATKLICVATRTPGPDVIIEDGVNGFLVDFSLDHLREGLEKAVSLEPEERTQMGNHARETAVSKYCLGEAVENALRLLKIGYVPAGEAARQHSQLSRAIKGAGDADDCVAPRTSANFK
jgi:glycosyltransferase involved in cell wall biosynthesis